EALCPVKEDLPSLAMDGTVPLLTDDDNIEAPPNLLPSLAMDGYVPPLTDDDNVGAHSTSQNAPSFQMDHLYALPAILSDETAEEISPPPSENSPESTDIALSELVLPPKMRRRGRPKGASITVIGLPRKKPGNSSKPVAFVKRHVRDKERLVLSWLFTEEIAEKAMNSEYVIQVDDVSDNVNDLSAALLDES
ncbi:hypothetical protein JTE90_016582, partial [Oedothorax gibbosus]